MGKKIRFHLRVLKGLIKKYFFLLFIVALTSSLLFLLLPRLIQFLLRPAPVKVALVGQYSVSNLPAEVVNLLSFGLTKPGPNGQALPAAAQSWSVSQDGLIITFHLDTKLKWQDGTPFTSQDINYVVKDVEIDRPSPDTITFKLQDSYAPFPFTVSRPLFKNTLVGLGQYQVSQVKTSASYLSQIKLRDTNSQSPDYLFKIYPTQNAAITAFKLGEVDQINDLSNKPSLENWPQVTIDTQTHLDRYVSLIFNTQKGNFTDKNIRQAISYALDKSKLGQRALSSYHPQSWVYNSKVKPYDIDIDRAKSLLQKANAKDLEFEIAVWSTLLETAQEIQTDLEKVGIKTTLKVVNAVPEDFDALLIWQKIPPDPDQYNLWHSTQETNITQIKNPKLDKLLEDGRKTQDTDKRHEIYLDFQRFLLEEAPAVFLYHPVTYSLSRH